MLFKIVYIIFYIFVIMPLCELFVDLLEFKFRSEIYLKSGCNNFREYRKYKKMLFGSIIYTIINKK